MHPDSKLPTDAQRKMLCSMMGRAFIEIRALAVSGKGTQASDLADAFHNLPSDIWHEHFSFQFFRNSYLIAYKNKYPSGTFDYVGMLDEIIATRD
jgi:hypothetical protein